MIIRPNAICRDKTQAKYGAVSVCLARDGQRGRERRGREGGRGKVNWREGKRVKVDGIGLEGKTVKEKEWEEIRRGEIERKENRRGKRKGKGWR